MAVLVFGIVGYTITSILYTGMRVAEAERSLDAVVSHQNSLDETFGNIDAQLSVLNGSGKFDSQQALTLVDRSIQNSNLAGKTIDADDHALRAASADVRATRWLSVIRRGDLDYELTRIDHARAALAIARVIAADQALDGQFWRVLYASLADYSAYAATSSPVALKSSRAEVAYATVMAAYAPGLPDDLHALLTDLQLFLADTAKDTSVAGDLNRIASYNIDTIGNEISGFYQPMIDRYNAELSSAISA